MPLASYAEDGRAYIIDDGGFAASRIENHWERGIRFDADTIYDEFYMSSPEETETLVREARMSLKEFPERSR
jgi:hypothetical protein